MVFQKPNFPRHGAPRRSGLVYSMSGLEGQLLGAIMDELKVLTSGRKECYQIFNCSILGDVNMQRALNLKAAWCARLKR